MRKYVTILCLLLAASCEIPFALDDVSDPAIYVQYLPCNGEEHHIRVAYASPAFGKADMSKHEFNPSDVSLAVNGVRATLSEVEPDEAWNLHELAVGGIPAIKAGDRVEVSVAGRDVPSVSASSVIPAPPELKEVSVVEEKHDTTDVIKITIRLDHEVSEGEYYGIQAYQRTMTITAYGDSMLDLQLDTLYSESSFTPGQIATTSDFNSLDLDAYTNVSYKDGFLEAGLFSSNPLTLLASRQFDGDTYVFYANSLDSFVNFDGIDFEMPGIDVDADDQEPVSPDDPAILEPDYPEFYFVLSYVLGYRFEVYRLSDEFYNYAKAQYLSAFNMLSNFGVTPPNFTYSNIVGGLGIVAGAAVAKTDWHPSPVPLPDNPLEAFGF